MNENGKIDMFPVVIQKVIDTYFKNLYYNMMEKERNRQKVFRL